MKFEKKQEEEFKTTDFAHCNGSTMSNGEYEWERLNLCFVSKESAQKLMLERLDGKKQKRSKHQHQL